MTMNQQNIINSKTYQKYVKKKNITQKTLDTYVFSLLQFCKANNKPLDRMVEEVLEEQLPYIDGQGRIHEYNPEYGLIDNYITNTVDYLKRKGNKNNSIYAHLVRIRAVLTTLNIKLPKQVELEKDDGEWNVLSKEDIRYVNSISPLHHQALITFMAHTGIRTGDVIKVFTIEDFMKATWKYHECTELEMFLENAPMDMIGYWEFIPKKTKKYNVECKVYNTAESSNLILKSLHRRAESIENINKKKGTDYKLEKSDALFTSRNQNFKSPMTENTLSALFHRRNKELRKYKERLIYQEYKEGKISKETLEQKLSEIPVFHAHGLRKFFITALARKRVDLRASALLEGHSPVMQDKSYVDADELADLLYAEYRRVIPALSFMKDEEDFELSKKNHDLQIENAQLKQQKEQLEKEKLNLKEEVHSETRKVFEEILRENNIKL
ncbi:MAG: tyrosine-type recombinase/integrase [Methanobrevibacter sp.]|nr:tyrosine-type recombinase/integrase [Methanobrevibacter sp.]